MVRKTKEEAMNTRTGIMDAAIELFADKGVARTSLEEIAEAAGVTRGAVYWHFKNKLDILTAIYMDMHSSIMSELLDTEDGQNVPTLDQFIEASVAILLRHEHDLRLRRTTHLMLNSDHSGELAPVLAIKNQHNRESLLLTGAVFQNAINQGRLPAREDAATLALSFYCYIFGILHVHMRDPDLLPLSTQARPLVERFFK